MSDYTDKIAALSECFNEFEASPEYADYADFSKKFSAFLEFIDEYFPEDNPENEEVIKEQTELSQEKRNKIIEFFAKRTSHIPGLMTEDGKITDEFVSFIFNQVDNSISIDPPKPLVPSKTKLKNFYYPIYKNNELTAERTRGEEKMEEKKITTEMREELNALGMDDETINALKYDEALGILRDKDEISQKLDNLTDGQKITQEMREELNALGMDDETINALKFNEALGILRDKDEISQKLDELSLAANKKEELNFHEEEPAPVRTPTHDLHWIDTKVEEYQEMVKNGNEDIKTITPDKTAGTFTAEVDNGTITYTSPNDVSITKDSSYKVFDTVMKEPSNKGKAIRMPTDASKEFKTNLFVAAILNNHTVNGLESLEFDQETFDKIDLPDEQKAKVLAALPERTEEKVDKVSKDVKEAIDKLEEPKAKLVEMINSGKISASISSNAETKRNEIVFNFDPAKGGTQNDADEANRLFTEAIKSVDELRQKTLPADEDARNQAIDDNYAIKSAQLALIHSVYQPEPSEALKAKARIIAKKLGLTDEKVERDVVQRDDKGHILYETNEKGKPLYKRDADGNIMYQYKRDADGHFIRDEKTGELVRDTRKPVLVAKTEKQEVQTLDEENKAKYIKDHIDGKSEDGKKTHTVSILSYLKKQYGE